MNDQNEALAQTNFSRLSQNVYPGRGIVVGIDNTSKHLVQIYWIMGRSENSRNRVFKADQETGRLYTEAADASKMTNPALVIYNAMREHRAHYIVSNGNQTDMVAEHSTFPIHLGIALLGTTYEPDLPNFTPRITAMCSLAAGVPLIELSILRKSPFGSACDRLMYDLAPSPGFGHCITTYAEDGDPLPPFQGEPLLMPLRGNMETIAETYWNALDVDNRVSLAVKFIDIPSGMSRIHTINKNKQTA